ncbi:hypothetical protein BGX26_000366 [Mortierella sp. AD094]|nr:hypothetical protein BGX26_000366 [Mortierella sp. AD094]
MQYVRSSSLIPHRIKYIPDTVMDVVLNGEPPLGVKGVKNEKDKGLSITKPLFPVYSRDSNDDYIRFGYKICLRHMDTGSFLRTLNLPWNSSRPEWNVVYGVHCRDQREDDWWEVTTTMGMMGVKGLHEQNIQYGSRVRLFNVA